MSTPFPFSAIVGQDEMKLAMLIAAVEPAIGGVLVLGDRGTGKSTAVRGLAALLPPMRAVVGCRYHCDPAAPPACEECSRLKPPPAPAPVPARSSARSGGKPGTVAAKRRSAAALASMAAPSVAVHEVPVPVVDLPLGASEDRVVGALDMERALSQGLKVFEPGLLARAHRGFLYIDEVNLLEDHLVDLLIDVAASGENVVEREGLSVRHPARFVLVGSGNPEEGELRPQLLDRFGLSVEVRTPTQISERVEVVRRRDAYERDPLGFQATWAPEDTTVRARILAARERIGELTLPDAVLQAAAELCLAVGTDGLRGELTLVRAARAVAALDGAAAVTAAHLRRIAVPALRHRLRRSPLDDTGSAERIDRAVQDVWGD